MPTRAASEPLVSICRVLHRIHSQARIQHLSGPKQTLSPYSRLGSSSFCFWNGPAAKICLISSLFTCKEYGAECCHMSYGQHFWLAKKGHGSLPLSRTQKGHIDTRIPHNMISGILVTLGLGVRVRDPSVLHNICTIYYCPYTIYSIPYIYIHIL